jgi:hypothetical protein
MARDLPEQMRKLLDEALLQVIEEIRSQPTAKATRERTWPHAYARSESIAEEIEAKIGFPEQIATQLKERLCAFKYPYPHGTKKGTTFYDHLKKLRLLRWFFSWPFLWVVGAAWFRRFSDESEEVLRKKLISHHGYELAFHRELMREIARTLGHVSRILEKYRVPKEWLSDYRKASLKELWRQATSYYFDMEPGLYYKVPSRARSMSHDVYIQMTVLDAIEKRLAQRNSRNKTLAYQLTSLICSPQECVTTRKLSPDPEAVRTNDRARSAKLKKKPR